jgi:hypothetical protein
MWKLADLAESSGRRPSECLELSEAGWPLDVRLDFDFAVRDLKRWADHRANETDLVDAPTPSRNAKPKQSVPKYRTLADVLALTDEDAEMAQIAEQFGTTNAETLALDLLAGDWADADDEP